MATKRVLIFLLSVFLILSALAWGPMIWAEENTFSSGNEFIQAWSKIAVYLYIPWTVTLSFSGISLFMNIREKWAKAGVALCMMPVLLFVLSIGPLIHVCALGVDCI